MCGRDGGVWEGWWYVGGMMGCVGAICAACVLYVTVCNLD